MKIDKGKAQFTMHSLKRAEEYGLRVKSLLNAWYSSSQITLDEKRQAYKFSQYGMSSLDDLYTYHPPSDLLFTCHQTKSGLIKVLTITKRKMANG